MSSGIWGWSDGGIDPEIARERGLDPDEPRLRLALALASELTGFPRHLSQHVGGFVLTRSRLDEVVPIANAAMADRTVVEWDKDDLDALGILKIDVLALGMLTCIRKAFALLDQHEGRSLTLATVPAEDPAVYAMLGRADSIGVFQVESRAQMTMLPRLKPRCFYDLVIEVAIVRPGPIQGDMVHPYLRRRSGQEPVEYPSDALRAVLEKTLGVPLFQEQAMNIAIVGAGFTASEADQLRRAMATFRRVGTIHLLRDKFINGMIANGYARDFAERCFKQIEGFGTYGFPESHATSFALLVYVSSWLKCHHPAAFACALLNSQPMGFYAPAQIVRDARDHGVAVLPVDVNASDWDCTLEAAAKGSDLALRLGFRQVKGLKQEEMERLVARRGNGYPDLATLRRRAGISAGALDRLARADAFGSLALARRGALWSAIGLDRTGQELDQPPLFAWAEGAARAEPEVALPPMTLGEEVAQDYANLRLSLRCHPMALLRPWLGRRVVRAEQLAAIADGRRVEVAGITLVRQRPGTASGVIFVTLEDETGVANLVVWPAVFERYRRALLGAQLMVVRGKLQREGIVIHVVADALIDRSDLLARLGETTFRAPIAHADHVKSSGPPDPRDPGAKRREQTLLDDLRADQAAFEAPVARADAVRRPHYDPRIDGYRSRDFH